MYLFCLLTLVCVWIILLSSTSFLDGLINEKCVEKTWERRKKRAKWRTKYLFNKIHNKASRTLRWRENERRKWMGKLLAWAVLLGLYVKCSWISALEKDLQILLFVSGSASFGLRVLLGGFAAIISLGEGTRQKCILDYLINGEESWRDIGHVIINNRVVTLFSGELPLYTAMGSFTYPDSSNPLCWLVIEN